MDLESAIRTGGTIRYFSEREVPDEVLERAIEIGRFGPSGGNRQPVRWIAVRDPELKLKLGELYVPLWKRDMAAFLDGSMETKTSQGSAIRAADDFAEALGEVPVILVACAVLSDMHAHMMSGDEANLIGGSSVYPIVQNVCLALRAQGVGTAITTLLCEREEAVAEMLALPEGVTCACHIAVGYPEGGFPTRLTRLPVSSLLSRDRFRN